MATNLKIIRLPSEDILGEVLDDTDKGITLKNPVRVVLIPSKADPKVPSVGFAPFCEWSDDKEVTIHRNLIVTILNPITEFVNQYNSTFCVVIVPT